MSLEDRRVTERPLSRLTDRLVAGLQTKKEAPERESFKLFYETILSWELPAYQRKVVPLLEDSEHKRLLLLAPPGHSKTTLISAFAAWLLGNDPNRRIIVASHTLDYSRNLLAFIEELLTSQIFKSIFGDYVPKDGTKWTQTEKFLVRSDWRNPHPSLLALGVGSSTIGYRTDYILADDLVTQQNSMTPTQRSHLSNWFFGSLVKRLDPGGRIILTGARFYAKDLYGKLCKSWPSLVFCASPEEPLWPEMFSDQLIKRAREENYFTYLAQYQQRPPDLEASFLSEKFLNYYLVLPDEELTIFQGIDPDIKQDSAKQTDYFAIVTVGVDSQDKAYLLETVKCRASLQQQEELILQQAEKWSPRLINIETDGAQALLYQHLAKEHTLPLNPVTSGGVSKAIRFASMASYFRNKRVLLPGTIGEDGLPGPREDANSFINEWCDFPFSDDDALDAMEKALRAAFQTKAPAAASSGTSSREVAPAPFRDVSRPQIPKLFH